MISKESAGFFMRHKKESFSDFVGIRSTLEAILSSTRYFCPPSGARNILGGFLSFEVVNFYSLEVS